MFTDAAGQRLDLRRGIGRAVDHHMAKRFGQSDEIPLRVDHHLLHQPGAFFQQAAQQMRFAAARIALNQQTRGQQFFYVELDRSAAVVMADGDLRFHPITGSQPNPTSGRGRGDLSMRNLPVPPFLAHHLAPSRMAPAVGRRWVTE